MLFWIVAALLTVGACLAVLMPLVRPAGDAHDAREPDLAVYRDQMAEVERDASRGLIEPAEAEQARAEIGRRMLRIAAGAADVARGGRSAASFRWAAMIAVLAVPTIAWGFYAVTGSPHLPDEPLQARLQRDPAASSIEELVARAEQHLNVNPSDGRGWDVLAPIYLRLGRYADAEAAYRNAIRLNGASAAREAGHGEALAAVAGGLVTAEAQAAFERALALDPADPRARFFLATAKAQEGRIDEAAESWTAMLATLPAESPWREAVGQALAQARADTGPGPGEEEIEAAAAMSAEERTAMVEGMVARLDERLRDNPADRDGWIRLLRSYMVLGRKDEAQAAFDRAVAALAGDAAARRDVSDVAASLGLTKTE